MSEKVRRPTVSPRLVSALPDSPQTLPSNQHLALVIRLLRDRQLHSNLVVRYRLCVSWGTNPPARKHTGTQLPMNVVCLSINHVTLMLSYAHQCHGGLTTTLDPGAPVPTAVEAATSAGSYIGPMSS